MSERANPGEGSSPNTWDRPPNPGISRPVALKHRKFEDWWSTVPEDLKQKARKGDESKKILLNEVNYVFLHLHLAGKHVDKPSHEELKEWLHSGQVDVLRMNK